MEHHGDRKRERGEGKRVPARLNPRRLLFGRDRASGRSIKEGASATGEVFGGLPNEGPKIPADYIRQQLDIFKAEWKNSWTDQSRGASHVKEIWPAGEKEPKAERMREILQGILAPVSASANTYIGRELAEGSVVELRNPEISGIRTLTEFGYIIGSEEERITSPIGGGGKTFIPCVKIEFRHEVVEDTLDATPRPVGVYSLLEQPRSLGDDPRTSALAALCDNVKISFQMFTEGALTQLKGANLNSPDRIFLRSPSGGGNAIPSDLQELLRAVSVSLEHPPSTT